ncbi:MAG: acyl-CoA dehydrogenase [Pseudomonadota bacterium]
MQTEQLIYRRDLIFWLFEAGRTSETLSHAAYAEFDREDIEAMLDAVMELSEAELGGLADTLDAHEPELRDGEVWNHPSLAPALKSYIASGFHSAGFAPVWGGMGLPYAVTQALGAPVAAHAGTGIGYLFLTAAAANMLDVVGSDDQKARYLPKLVSGEWFGTMMLSEPQAGSSVGDIRTRAVRQSDGTYHLTGSKMWISGGDHALSDNIVHMVLAKIENDDGSLTSGSAGVSLFLAPKYIPDTGERNGIHIAGLNHKMGQRGTVNTVPVLGEDRPCVAELLGAPGKGLAGMCHMMNEARIGVGLSAAQFAWNGYRYSLAFARDRVQGRPLTGSPASAPIPIIEHADVKRMLLAQKAIAEGAMALCLFAADLVDAQRCEERADKPNDTDALLALLTPIVKSWPSMHGLEANHLAIQVMGGYGYTRDFPVERIYRDNRLNEIHEGTTGIQSLDLVGRKLLKDQGAGLKVLLAHMQASIEEAAQDDELAPHARALAEAVERLGHSSAALGAAAAGGELDKAMANSVVYLDMTGHIVVAWMWLRMAITARRAQANASPVDQAFYRGKLSACAYFFRHELPRTEAQAALLARLDTTCLDVSPDEF